MFKADDYRLKIKALGATLEETAEALDIGGLTSQLAALKAEQEDPEVWQDLERSKKIGREVSSVESRIASYEKSKKAVDDVNEVIDLVEETGRRGTCGGTGRTDRLRRVGHRGNAYPRPSPRQIRQLITRF